VLKTQTQQGPFPQDPTACPPGTRPASPVPRPPRRGAAY
jgi:hypothetical protein